MYLPNGQAVRMLKLRSSSIILQNYKADNNCHQWFTGNSGTVKTFNFDAANAHFLDGSYGICVRRDVGVLINLLHGKDAVTPNFQERDNTNIFFE
jgi:hypothetical protein